MIERANRGRLKTHYQEYRESSSEGYSVGIRHTMTVYL